jgi:hypothetical protein
MWRGRPCASDVVVSRSLPHKGLSTLCALHSEASILGLHLLSEFAPFGSQRGVTVKRKTLVDDVLHEDVLLVGVVTRTNSWDSLHLTFVSH